MKRKQFLLLSTALALALWCDTFAQGPGQATNPNPPDSSIDIQPWISELSWDNPPGTEHTNVWMGIHPDYLTSVYSGRAINSIQFSATLEYRKSYFWRIDASDQTGTTEGNIWLFTTLGTLGFWQISFIDSFNTGTINWEISNNGGDCIWDTMNLCRTSYDMPVTADGFVFSADGARCGVGTSTFSTATLNSPLDLVNHSEAFVFWDNDWYTKDTTDAVFVELSIDSGLSWISIWQRPGISFRKSQVFVDITNHLQIEPLLLRLRTIQNGSDSWWAIDNLFIGVSNILSPQTPASNLIAFGLTNNNYDSVWVDLEWIGAGGIATGHRIKRKLGDQYSQYMYLNIADVAISTSSYKDITVEDETYYTYKIGIFEGPFEFYRYSNESTIITPPIPVELTSFTATVIGNNVQLYWVTATELNNYGFDILRQAQDDEWVTMGFVPGQGTTTKAQHYSFIDEAVSSGIYRYRLKQIDYDGSLEYSETVEVEVSLPTKFLLEQNYPNPFNPTTIIKYTIPSQKNPLLGGDYRGGLITIKVFDVLGNEVARLVNEVKSSGNYEVEFNGNDLTSGIYFYRLSANDFSETKKMILLR